MIFSKNNASLLIKTLKENACLTENEIDFYLRLLTVRIVPKKEHYLMPGDICNYVAYINKGCMRRYIINNHSKESIINFALEDYWTGDLESFLSQRPTIYYIQALEESELFLLTRENFSRACEKLPKFKEFHDIKMHRNHYYSLKRLSIAKSATPEEKYKLLLNEQPQLFQRVPQHLIASYLGIEPESLSRLRKRIIINPTKS